MTCRCAARRKALGEIRRAVVAGDKGEVKQQVQIIGRSIRRDLANLRKMGRRR